MKTHRPPPPPIAPPPSSTGISRLSPAPEAEEPTLTVEPGNFCVTDVSTPDSFAVEVCQNWEGVRRVKVKGEEGGGEKGYLILRC